MMKAATRLAAVGVLVAFASVGMGAAAGIDLDQGVDAAGVFAGIKADKAHDAVPVLPAGVEARVGQQAASQNPDNGKVLNAASQYNRRLDELVQASDLAGASEGLKQALRNASASLATGTTQLERSFEDVKRLETKLAENGDVEAASNGLIDAMVPMSRGANGLLDLLPYKAELDALKDKQPYSNARVAHLAVGVSLRNFQRSLAEMNKELTALSLEINQKAALVGAEGINDEALKTLDYAAAMSAGKDEWAGFDVRLNQAKSGAPTKEFYDSISTLQSLAVYNLPESK